MFKSKLIGTIVIATCLALLTPGATLAGMAKDLPLYLEPLPVVQATEDNRADIGIEVDGRRLTLDVQAFIENGRTLIPLRGVVEELGATVEWDGNRKAVVIQGEGVSVELIIGKDSAEITRSIDGTAQKESLKLDVAAKIVAGRTFIPGRFVSETLGAKVEWNEEGRLVIITSKKENAAKAIKFELVTSQELRDNELLSKWYQENHQTGGIYSLTAGEWMYVLVAAGEKPTGGYDLQIYSIIEISPGTAYVSASLKSPSKDDIVTQALTYPHAIARFTKGNIKNVEGNITPTPPDKLTVKDYFPLHEGCRWQYRGEGMEYASFEREVLYVAGDRAQIKENNGGTVSASIIKITEDAIIRTFFQGEQYDNANLLDREANDNLVILQGPLEAGTRWETPTGVREIVATDAAIATPAGLFTGCIKVKIESQYSTTYEYYKDGIGMVKREFITEDTLITSTLEQFQTSKTTD